MTQQPPAITVYGAEWCEDTTATRHHLDSLGVPYRYIDVDQQPDAKDWIKARNNGKQQTPAVDIGGQRVLIEPDERTLEEALRGTGAMG